MDLAHTRLGDGPTLVVIRQLDKPLWEPVIERLVGDREVVAVDLPGFGDSPPLQDGETPSPPALAAAVAAWFPSVGLERPPVAGNSLGGAVAVELARAAAVSNSTALSPVGSWTRAEAAYALGSLRVARGVARALGSRAGRVAGNPVGRTLAFGQIAWRPARITEAAAAEMLRGLTDSPGFEATRRGLLSYRLPGFESKVPVTIAWGKRDLLTPPHQARRATRVLPEARHLKLSGCGHSPMFDDPGQVAHLLLEPA